MKSDDTIVLGWNNGQQILYAKTFHYLSEKIEAQVALKYVSEKFKYWKIGHLSGFRLEDNHDFEFESEKEKPLFFNQIPF